MGIKSQFDSEYEKIEQILLYKNTKIKTSKNHDAVIDFFG
jgi:hypothetical protein